MGQVLKKEEDSEKLFEDGWNALVKKLGPVKATKFILQYEKREGSYTKDSEKFFEGKNAKEIHNEIMAWKKEINAAKK